MRREDYLQRLDRLVQRLNEDPAGWRFDRKSLAQLISGVQQFMEDALGIKAIYKTVPKLPARLFRNFAADGPLYVIASECGNYMKARNMKRHMDLLARIRQELVRGGHLRMPRVFVHASTGTNQLKLRDTVKRLGGETAQAADAPGVTHVVFPFGPKGDPDDGKQYLRTLEVSNGRALVHFWYLPDSYDEWVAIDTAPAEVAPERRPKGPWKVYVRWLTDSDKYNEWMNEEDYETEEAAAEAEAAGAKRKAGVEEEPPPEVPLPTKKARVLGGAKALPEVDADAGEAVAPGVTRQTVIHPNRKAMEGYTSVDISQGQRPEGSGIPQAVPSHTSNGPQQQQQQAQPEGRPQLPGGDTEMTEADAGGGGRETPAVAAAAAAGAGEQQQQQQQQQEAQQQRVGDDAGGAVKRKEVYRIPACCSWFNWKSIAVVEREAFPDYFSSADSNKSATLYRQIRNAIINKEDPSRELDFTTARRHLTAEVNQVREIYEQLVAWGLINYTARQQAHPDGLAALELVPDDRLPGSLRISRGPGAEALLKLPSRVKPSEGAEAAAQGGGGSARVGLRRGAFAPPAERPPAVATGVRYFCNAMPWVDCTALRYHCTKIPDVDLCPEAFAGKAPRGRSEGRFPPGCTAKDFVRLDARQAAPDPSGWTDQETLLLLEGLELYGENWAQIAEHVGTKTQMQCIMHFLQMPIEEQFLGDLGATRGRAGVTEPAPPPDANGAEPPAGEAGAAGQAAQGRTAAVAVPEDLVPFADVGNPVMAQVGFLAAMVGPRIAAAAAQRALEVLAEEDPTAGAAVQELDGTGDDGRGANGAQAAAAAAGPGGGISSAKARTAAATALSAAAVKARLLADAEERECQRLVVAAVEAQFHKVQLKLQYLEQLDEVMVAERSQLEAMRTQFYRERTALMEATSQAQQVQQLAAMQVAQAQQQASMIQHQAAQQVKAAQQVLMQQQQQHQAGSGQAGVLAAGAGGSVPSGATGSQQ
ncbi:hypothetical protein N2152v2_006086 [Parachlorella kessleri]